MKNPNRKGLIRIKKLIYVLGLLLLLGTPTLVHAEDAGTSMVSEEQSSNQKNEQNEEYIKTSSEDIDLFTEQVEVMSVKRIYYLIDNFALKSELTDVEKEKVEILNKEIEVRKESANKSLNAFNSCLLGLLILLGTLIIIGGGTTFILKRR